MQTNDPALTKTRIVNDETDGNVAAETRTPHVGLDHKNIDHEQIEENTTVNKGTDTFKEDIVETEHVNDDDNPARQPDRRDQQGSTPFDEGINDETVGSEEPKSDELTDMNRYATIDNAQTRILNPDEKD